VASRIITAHVAGEESDTRLLDAVDALTLPRTLRTWIHNDETGMPERLHSEQHPALLMLLMQAASAHRSGANGGSADPGVPIDADAIELLAEVGDRIREWTAALGGETFRRDDLLGSIRLWYLAHVNGIRRGVVSKGADLDVTRSLESWVRRIMRKFDPDEVREWTAPCPAWIERDMNTGYKWVTVRVRCRAQRIERDGTLRYAVSVNVTQKSAECAVCGTRWEGMSGLMELRYLSNTMDAPADDTPGETVLAPEAPMPQD
jgi:hypothetical protein